MEALLLREPQNIYVLNNQTQQPHDKFFRTVMSDKRVARDFLKSYLPQDIAQVIDWENLELKPRSYINEVRKESIVDVLFKTTIENNDAYLYLLVEHQSKPDALMPFRMLKYMVNIMDDHIRQTKQKKLPLIYPMVVYQADKPYPYSTDILDIIEAPRILAERYFLKPFHLIDLGTIEDEEIKKHAWSGIMEFALKHVIERDILPWVKDIVGLMRHLVLKGGEKYVEIVVEYLFERADTEAQNEFISLINKEISTEMGEKVMTIAERFRLEGLQQGIQKGLEKGKLEGKLEGIEEVKTTIAKRLLAEKVDSAFIARITQLTIAEIKLLEE